MGSQEFIPLSEPCIAGNAMQYVDECLETAWVSTVGSYVTRFEAELSRYLDVPNVVATNSGTSALHLALKSVGVGPGDEVLLPTMTFVATANAVKYLGAEPVFFDVDPSHWTIDTELVARFLEEDCSPEGGVLRNSISKRRIAAVVPVHLYGHPAEIERLLELCDRFRLPLVEDAAESLGARYKGERVACAGHAAILSFNGNKTITTGAGGAVLTHKDNLAARILHLSTQAKQDALAYVHDEVGYNYRMSNIHAALGVSQIEMLDDFLAKKQEVSELYRSRLGDLSAENLVTFQTDAEWADSSHWLNALVFSEHLDKSGTEPLWREAVQFLQEQSIQSRPLWHPLHQLEPFRDAMSVLTGVAESIVKRGICLPSSVSLNIENQERVIDAVRVFVERRR